MSKKHGHASEKVKEAKEKKILTGTDNLQFERETINEEQKIFNEIMEIINKTSTSDDYQNHTKDNNYVIEENNYEIEEEIIKDKIYKFCTIAGKEYVFKVLALYYSLDKHSKNFHLWICCVDDDALYIFTKINLKNVTVLSMKDIENEELTAIKESRKKSEYCWTLKAPLIKYVLSNNNVDSVIYCDGDMYFFSDPKAIFDEWDGYSVYMCPQRDLEWVHNIYGRYQAGLIGFRNDENGLNSLNWWKEKCIEWCYGYPETELERWGDQKYLDKIPSLFKNVKISENLGVDAAPWNTIYNNNFNIHSKDKDIYIENYKLIAYHFACISIYNDSEYDLWTFNYLDIKKIIKSKIYLPYIESIRAAIDKVKSSLDIDINLLFCTKDVKEAKTYFLYSQLSIEMLQYEEYYSFCTIVSKDYIIKFLTLYTSLKSKINNFHLWICCMDEITLSTLSKIQLENVTILNVSEIEDNELLQVKSNRTVNEYCWTLKAPLVLHLFNKYKLTNVLYCDSDLFFFSDPKELLDEWKGYDTLMCKQRVYFEFEKIYGRFQAGLLGFRNEKGSRDILEWWKQKCIEWCFSNPQPEMERWGDQKYLDKVPNLFSSIKIVENLGIDAAPWNLIIHNHYKVHKKNDNVYIENNKLVVYHFGSMRIYSKNEFDLWKLEPLSFSNSIIENIYHPYFEVINSVIKLLKEKSNDDMNEFFSKDDKNDAKNLYKY